MTTTAPNKSDGFEWRVLLGPTHDWRVPELEFRKEQLGSEERCELCGEPIDQGKPFVTNSAGKQPMHISCPVGEQPAAVGLRPAHRIWAHLLQSFVSG
jgi:hypothetical protein